MPRHTRGADNATNARKSQPMMKALEAIIDSKKSPIDIKEIAYQFMHQIGGPGGFVARIMEEYDGSPKGSLARSRILEIMVKLFQIATPKEKYGELSHLSDEDLTDILKQGIGKREVADNGWIEHPCI